MKLEDIEQEIIKFLKSKNCATGLPEIIAGLKSANPEIKASDIRPVAYIVAGSGAIKIDSNFKFFCGEIV